MARPFSVAGRQQGRVPEEQAEDPDGGRHEGIPRVAGPRRGGGPSGLQATELFSFCAFFWFK